MRVTVELFGIPRLRAGITRVDATGKTLGEVFCELAERFPSLGETCICGRHLREGFSANLRGERFVSDPDTILEDGDSILLLSTDAGG